ncbi:MAG: hypothetical protein GX587_04940, partial [Bacteroidales bacterium]|nr:hypothetical protein [Bacteroidales bacterium]
ALKGIITSFKARLKARKELKLIKLIEKAEMLRVMTGYRYYILKIKGKNKIVSKQTAKRWCKDGTFRKGTTIEMIEKIAIYKTRL